MSCPDHDPPGVRLPAVHRRRGAAAHMNAFADACHRPFCNGTEHEAWHRSWCEHCAHDHAMHTETGHYSNGCDIILEYLTSDGDWGGEAWLPEPDDGKHHLPSRLTCLAFEPCEPCGGDPYAEVRAEQIAAVTAYWKDRR